ncbi:hypothetical protein, partial [Pseudotabrizicola sp.]|uniref:hypothetical protein n=1 Tax=Pseudotabrizicola sp. TaxID=2939647 RepID=UPI002726BF87
MNGFQGSWFVQTGPTVGFSSKTAQKKMFKDNPLLAATIMRKSHSSSQRVREQPRLPGSGPNMGSCGAFSVC